MITYEGIPGQWIDHAAAEAAKIAKKYNETILFTFNDIKIFVKPDDIPEAVSAAYAMECNRRQNATKVIHKYPLRVGRNEVELPWGAKILSVANQRENIAMWAEVNDTHEKVSRLFHVVLTGASAPAPARYIGTVMLDGGNFVVHVYEDTND